MSINAQNIWFFDLIIPGGVCSLIIDQKARTQTRAPAPGALRGPVHMSTAYQKHFASLHFIARIINKGLINFTYFTLT